MHVRKQKRFTPKKRAYLTITRENRSGPAERCEVLDMSMGGASLKYVPKGETFEPGENVFLEIFGVSMPNVIVEKIRCRVVHDVDICDFPNNSMRLRQCGLEFQDLTQLQSHLIGHYIQLFSRDKRAYKTSYPR